MLQLRHSGHASRASEPAAATAHDSDVRVSQKTSDAGSESVWLAVKEDCVAMLDYASLVSRWLCSTLVVGSNV